ncbi:hypothetical protein SAMN05444407_102298 [Chryseobacterium contaminans]|uniref:Cyclic nucleotide-binding domain-containing protein n=1 Tax=Chryseobacterium contaminans TaxID=1423959 RepID=A0A1M6Y0P3_9FLAO|nr:hypothetical protein [Chryseobacterium contaminans]SHL11689.1 hypothetical protein SAMN05444407_102298 [Chryseobacterium contaminans]
MTQLHYGYRYYYFSADRAFSEIVPLKKEEIDLVIQKLEFIQLKKKDYLLREGQVSRHIRFIAQGSLYAFHIDEKGKENITQLGIENWWINDLYSYLSELPSIYLPSLLMVYLQAKLWPLLC